MNFKPPTLSIMQLVDTPRPFVVLLYLFTAVVDGPVLTPTSLIGGNPLQTLTKLSLFLSHTHTLTSYIALQRIGQSQQVIPHLLGLALIF